MTDDFDWFEKMVLDRITGEMSQAQCSGSRDDELEVEDALEEFKREYLANGGDDILKGIVNLPSDYVVTPINPPTASEESEVCICESKVLFNKGCQCEYGNEELIKEKYNG